MGFRNAAVVVEYKCDFDGIVVEWRGGGKEEVERSSIRGIVDRVSLVVICLEMCGISKRGGGGRI